MIQFPSQITKITTMSDGSLRVQVDTQEIPNEEKSSLFGMFNKFGWMLFKENPFTDSDVESIDELNLPEVRPEFEDQKSPSERLRNVLFVWYSKKGGNPKNFEKFRVEYMEKKINEIKGEIEKLN